MGGVMYPLLSLPPKKSNDYIVESKGEVSCNKLINEISKIVNMANLREAGYANWQTHHYNTRK